MVVAVADSTRVVLADADAAIARARANVSLVDAYLANATSDALAIADEWLARVEQLADQAERESRRARKNKPSVTARMMAPSPTGQAA